MRNGHLNEVDKLFKQLGKETRNLVESAIELSWYSRGAWSYNDVLMMSAGERDAASAFITKRLDGQAKAMYPVY